MRTMMQQEDCKRLDLHQTRPTAERVYLVEPDAGWRNNMQATITTAATPIDSTARRRGLKSSLSIALAGSGGSGVMTAGTLLLDAAAKAGLYGIMVRTSGPQIRGGEAAALVRLAGYPVESLGDGFELLLAIDWQNVNRFADEIPLGASSMLIGDPDEGDAPEIFKSTGARYL